jgi:hypothetical protein
LPALIGRYGKRMFDKANDLVKNENLSRRAVRNVFVAVLGYDGAFENEKQLEDYLERVLVASSAKLLSERYKDVPEQTLTRRSNAESEAALAAAAAVKAEAADEKTETGPAAEQKPEIEPAAEQKLEPEPAAAETAEQNTQADEPAAEAAGEEVTDDEGAGLALVRSETAPDMAEPNARKRPGRLLNAVCIVLTLAVLAAVLINFNVIPF